MPTVEQILRIVTQGDTGGITQVSGALDTLSGKGDETASKLKAAGVAAGAIGALAVAGLGAAAKAASDYDDSISRIKGLTSESAASVDAMSQQVLALSRTTSQSPKQLADALYFVVSAGFSGQKAMDVLAASSKAAAAGLGDTMTVANVVTSALTAYKLPVSDASKVTDTLVAAVTAGKMPAADLASSLGRVMPIASSMGVSLDQVTASIATMTRAGLSTDEATTALRSALSGLEKPSKTTVGALEAIGLSADDVRKEIADKGLLATFQDLMDKTGGNTQALTELFPNIRALTGVLATAGSQMPAYAANLDSVTNSAGRTNQAFAEAQKTTSFQLDQLKNNADVLAIEVGSKVLPIVNSLAQLGIKAFGWILDADIPGKISDVANALEKLIPRPVLDALQKFSDLFGRLASINVGNGMNLGALVGGLGALSIGGLAVGGMGMSMIPGLSGLVGGIGGMIPGVGALGGLLGGIPGLGALGGAGAGGLATAALPVAAGLGAAGAGVAALLTKTDLGEDLTHWLDAHGPDGQKLGTKLGDAFGKMASDIMHGNIGGALGQAGAAARGLGTATGVVGGALAGSGLGKDVGAAFKVTSTGLENLGQMAAADIQKALPVILGELGQLGQQILAKLGDTWKQIAPELGQALGDVGVIWGRLVTDAQAVWDKVGPVIKAALTIIVGLIGDQLNWITTHWHDIWSSVSGVVQGVFAIVMSIVRGFVGQLQGVIEVVKGILTGNWSEIWKGVTEIVSSTFDELKGILGGLLEIFKAPFDTLGPLLSSILSGIGDKLSDLGQAVLSGLSKLPGLVMDALSGLGGLILDGLKALPGLLETALVDAAKGAGLALALAILGIPLLIKDFGPKLLSVLQEGFRAAWDWISTNVPTWPGKVLGFLTAMASDLAGLGGDLAAAAGTAFGAAWDWISTNVPTWPGKVLGFLGALAGDLAGLGGDWLTAEQKGWGDIWNYISTEVPTWPGKILGFLADLPARLGQLAADTVSAFGAGFSALGDIIAAPLNAAIGIINGFISGVNDVLGALGAPKIPSIPSVSGSGGGSGLPAGGSGAATGSTGFFAVGGEIARPQLAVVGEDSPRYPEYIIPTNPAYRSRAASLLASAASRLGLLGLAGGGQAGGSGGIPGDIGGILGGIGGAVRGGAEATVGALGDLKNLLSRGLDALLAHLPKLSLSGPGFLGDMLSAIAGKLTSAAVSLVTGAFGAAKAKVRAEAANAPGNVTDWIAQAIAATGVDPSWAAGLAIIAMNESSGDPNAVNLTDVNAKAGNPSQGLMQITGSNFAQYGPAGGNILDPVQNIIAAIRYIQAVYGSIDNVPGVRSVNGGGPYLPYAAGGSASWPQLALVGEDAPRYPEYIIPTNPSYRGVSLGLLSRAARRLGLRGYAAGGAAGGGGAADAFGPGTGPATGSGNALGSGLGGPNTNTPLDPNAVNAETTALEGLTQAETDAQAAADKLAQSLGQSLNSALKPTEDLVVKLLGDQGNLNGVWAAAAQVIDQSNLPLATKNDLYTQLETSITSYGDAQTGVMLNEQLLGAAIEQSSGNVNDLVDSYVKLVLSQQQITDAQAAVKPGIDALTAATAQLTATTGSEAEASQLLGTRWLAAQAQVEQLRLRMALLAEAAAGDTDALAALGLSQDQVATATTETATALTTALAVQADVGNQADATSASLEKNAQVHQILTAQLGPEGAALSDIVTDLGLTKQKTEDWNTSLLSGMGVVDGYTTKYQELLGLLGSGQATWGQATAGLSQLLGTATGEQNDLNAASKVYAAIIAENQATLAGLPPALAAVAAAQQGVDKAQQDGATSAGDVGGAIKQYQDTMVALSAQLASGKITRDEYNRVAQQSLDIEQRNMQGTSGLGQAYQKLGQAEQGLSAQDVQRAIAAQQNIDAATQQRSAIDANTSSLSAQQSMVAALITAWSQGTVSISQANAAITLFNQSYGVQLPLLTAGLDPTTALGAALAALGPSGATAQTGIAGVSTSLGALPGAAGTATGPQGLGAVPGAANAIKQPMADAKLAVDSISQAFVNLGPAVQGDMDYVNDSLKGKLIEMQQTAGAQSLSIGQAIDDGIVRGLVQDEPAILRELAAIAADIQQAMKSMLKVGSPSRVMQEIGQQVSAGLALGMRDGLPDVAGAAALLAKAGVPLLGGAAPAGMGGLGFGAGDFSRGLNAPVELGALGAVANAGPVLNQTFNYPNQSAGDITRETQAMLWRAGVSLSHRRH